MALKMIAAVNESLLNDAGDVEAGVDSSDDSLNYLCLLLVIPMVAVPYLSYYYLRR